MGLAAILIGLPSCDKDLCQQDIFTGVLTF